MKKSKKLFGYIYDVLFYIMSVSSLMYPICSILPLSGFTFCLNWDISICSAIIPILGFITGVITWCRKKWFFPYIINTLSWICFILSLILTKYNNIKAFCVLLLISSIQFTSYTWIMPVATPDENIRINELITNNSNIPLKDNPRFYAIIAGILMIIISIVLIIITFNQK